MLSVSIDKYVFSGTAGAGRAGTNDTSNHGDKHQRVTACQTHSAHTLLQHARTHELNDLGFPLTKKKKGLQSSALQPIYQSSERKGLLSNAKHKWKNRSSTIPIILSTNSVKNQKKHCRGIAHVSHKHMHNIYLSYHCFMMIGKFCTRHKRHIGPSVTLRLKVGSTGKKLLPASLARLKMHKVLLSAPA